jgi:hypothetical protein
MKDLISGRAVYIGSVDVSRIIKYKQIVCKLR